MDDYMPPAGAHQRWSMAILVHDYPVPVRWFLPNRRIAKLVPYGKPLQSVIGSHTVKKMIHHELYPFGSA